MIPVKNKLIICGDSFNIGIGCPDLHKEPYGSVLADTLGLDLVNLAKGSSTNLSIYLQAEYAVNNIATENDIVLISHTSYDRVDWFPWDDDNRNYITNADVNYHQYPPYGENTNYQILENHPMANDINYNGRMFTENFLGVIDYWETFRKDDKESGYYSRFKDEPKERMKTLYDFAITIHDTRINRMHSMGVITMAHQLLKNKNIKHLILTGDVVGYSKLIDRKNLVDVCWETLSLKHPDELKTLHTGPEGHNEAARLIMNKLIQNEWVVRT
jgi:hypothetical protein